MSTLVIRDSNMLVQIPRAELAAANKVPKEIRDLMQIALDKGDYLSLRKWSHGAAEVHKIENYLPEDDDFCKNLKAFAKTVTEIAGKTETSSSSLVEHKGS